MEAFSGGREREREKESERERKRERLQLKFSDIHECKINKLVRIRKR